MTKAPATPSLVERLRSRGFTVGEGRDGGIRRWRLEREEAADALKAQQARIAELEGDLKAALREVGKHAREAGEAIGRLEMSEAAGIVDGWRERAEAAEALADRYEKALREACDLLAERTYGSPARSPGHNARLTLEAALSSQGSHEGGEGGLPELPCGVGPSDQTDPQSQHSDGEGA